MLIPQEGDKLKHSPTGILYEVKGITKQFVILYSLDGLSQILVEKMSLLSFFESEKVPQAEPA
jgi:hypothetical protein